MKNMSNSLYKPRKEELYTKSIALILLAIIGTRFLIQHLEHQKIYDEPVKPFIQTYTYISLSSINQGTNSTTTTTL